MLMGLKMKALLQNFTLNSVLLINLFYLFIFLPPFLYSFLLSFDMEVIWK